MNLQNKLKYVDNVNGTYTHIVRRVETFKTRLGKHIAVKFLCGSTVCSDGGAKLIFRLKPSMNPLCRHCNDKNKGK